MSASVPAGHRDHWSPWSLRELVARLRAGAYSAEQAREHVRARIETTEPDLRAWVQRSPGTGTNTHDGPLAGAPIGVKDIIDLRGLPTRCGSPLKNGAAPAHEDADAVSAWRRAGAVPLGKTVTTEFAYFSPGPTRNPADLTRTPGGSSSGSAAAVAAGQVPLALGTQTAGSVTRPAAFCGVASLVMTHGRLGTRGVTGLSPSLDSHGLYTARVHDLALAWSALTGAADAGRAPAGPPRLLLWTAASTGAVTIDMAAALDSAADRLTDAGAVMAPFPDPGLVDGLAHAQRVVMACEAAQERAAEADRWDRLSTPFQDLLRTGANTSRSVHRQAHETVAGARPHVSALLNAYDAILAPAAPGPAPEGTGHTGDPVLSRPWQALGLPAVTVPGARDRSGLPLGLQLVGAAGQETRLLSTACWAEAVLHG